MGVEEAEEAGEAEAKSARKAAGVSKEETSPPPARPGSPRKWARAEQLEDDMTDVASTAGSSASAWLSEAPTDFATDLADVADVQSLKPFSSVVARRRARAPPPVLRTLSSASTVVLEEAEEAEEEAEEVEEAAEAEPVLSLDEWERQESLMLLAAKASPLLLAAEEEQGHAPGAALLGACPSRASRAHCLGDGAIAVEHEVERCPEVPEVPEVPPASAAAAPPPPPAPPLLPPRKVGALPAGSGARARARARCSHPLTGLP